MAHTYVIASATESSAPDGTTPILIQGTVDGIPVTLIVLKSDISALGSVIALRNFIAQKMLAAATQTAPTATASTVVTPQTFSQ
ncbi:MAG TPA: hypothetical protein VND65_18135 [Candidatus Binatia bacterium]|nr:hypothetical protein [Candidatus Binatia bacterium]